MVVSCVFGWVGLRNLAENIAKRFIVWAIVGFVFTRGSITMFQYVTTYLGPHVALLTLVSFCISLIILLFREQFPRLSGRVDDLKSVQSMHTRQTPRVGGIAIFVALLFSVIFAPITIMDRYFDFIISAAFLFFVGLLEDLGFHVSPRKRLLAAATASLLVIVLLGVWIPRIGVPGLDGLVGNWALGIPLTLLLTAGIANGFNLIDGVNGLASVTSMVAAIALGLISMQAGYTVMGHLSIMLVAAIFGFFLLNFPFGLIFLGDAGAYTIGFVLSWFAIAVLINAPDVSPWAILLVVFWPVADTVLAIYRRFKRRMSAMAPDRLHVHQMVMRTLEICWLSRARRSISNPLTTLLLFPFLSAPPIAGVMLWDQNVLSFLAVCLFACLFFLSYVAAPRLTARFRVRRSSQLANFGLLASAAVVDEVIPDRNDSP